MDKFAEWLVEFAGGKAAGTHEIAKTPLSVAMEYARMTLGEELFYEIKDFASNYKHAQKQAKLGWTQRKQMPVIDSMDAKEFQNRLMQGFLDLRKPFAAGTNPIKPFPEGLSGEKASQWLQNGLAKNDGDAADDRVKVMAGRTAVGALKPIQRQIYLSKVIDPMAKRTIPATINFMTTQTIFVTSSDNYIIDGHHRYVTGMLLNPNMRVQTVAIDLSIKELLPLSRAYGDAIGNKRNK